MSARRPRPFGRGHQAAAPGRCTGRIRDRGRRQRAAMRRPLRGRPSFKSYFAVKPAAAYVRSTYTQVLSRHILASLAGARPLRYSTITCPPAALATKAHGAFTAKNVGGSVRGNRGTGQERNRS